MEIRNGPYFQPSEYNLQSTHLFSVFSPANLWAANNYFITTGATAAFGAAGQETFDDTEDPAVVVALIEPVFTVPPFGPAFPAPLPMPVPIPSPGFGGLTGCGGCMG